MTDPNQYDPDEAPPKMTKAEDLSSWCDANPHEDIGEVKD